MRTKLRSKFTLLFMAFAMLLAVPAVAFADDISNGLDTDPTVIDATVEQTSVQLGGPAGSDAKQVSYVIQPRNGDGDSGCNMEGTTQAVVVDTASSAPGVATVSPSKLTFDDCGDTPSVTVTGVSPGTANITLTEFSNNTGGSFNYTTATFQVNVNRATSITDVSGEGTEGSTATLTATLNSLYSGTSDVSGKNIEFFLNGVSQGTAATDSDGVATKSVTTLPATFTASGSPYAGAVSATFAGVAGYAASGPVSGDLIVNPANTKPSTPGVPSGTTPNQGAFTLNWTASADGEEDPITYTLQHKDANDASFTNVATGISGNSYTFGGTNAVEAEGTWTYRVQASDGSLSSDFSAASSAIVVDRGAPNAPTAGADRLPDYNPTGTANDWFLNTVTVTFTDNGDPILPDGSAGSGVKLSTLTAPIVKNTSGSHTVNGTVQDNATNLSAAGSLTVQVDATVPNVNISGCPTTSVTQGSSQSVSVTASDAHSGLATDPNNPALALDTSTIGPQIKTVTAVDNVGLSKQASCSYYVVHNYSGVLQPINGGSTATFTDDTSVFKQGSTVPVKFQLLGNSAGITNGTFYLYVYKVGNGDGLGDVEAVSTSAATTGNLFRYDATSGQYIFNLGTKSLSAGMYELRIYLNNGTPPSGLQGAVQIELKK
jgi:hypothetical protein